MGISYEDREDGAWTSGVHGSVTVGTSAVEAKVGASALSNRIHIVLQAKDSGVFWGTSNTVTTSSGIEIFKDQTIFLPANSAVWLIATGTGKNVRVIEYAGDQIL